MLAAGFSAPIDTISGTTESRIYSYQFNAAVKGTAYLRIDVNSSLQVRQQLSDNWDTVSDSATGAMPQSFAVLTSTNTLTLHAINHPEIRGVILIDGTTVDLWLGYLRPANKESWWNEASHLFAFLPGYVTNWTTPFYSLLCAPNPFGFIANTSAFTFANDLIDAPPSPGNYQLHSSPYLYGISSPARCAVGRFSNEVAIAAANGRSLLDVYRAGTEEYVLLTIAGNTGIAVRKV